MLSFRLTHKQALPAATFTVLTAFAAMATIVLPTPTHAGPILDKVRASKILKIGYRPDYSPFSYTLLDGKLTGYGIESCGHIAQSLGKSLGVNLRLIYVPVSIKDRMAAVQNGEIDLECADTTNTRERREKYGVAFLSPYFVTGVRILSHTRSGVDKPEALKGKTVIYPASSTSEIIAQKYQTVWGFQPRVCGPLFSDCMKELENGTADHWMMDDIALQISRATSSSPGSYQVLGKLLSVEHLAIMYKSGDSEWSAQLNAAMHSLMTSGEGRRLYQKWFEQPIPPNGINLQMRMPPLLNRYINRPSPEVGEYVVY